MTKRLGPGHWIAIGLAAALVIAIAVAGGSPGPSQPGDEGDGYLDRYGGSAQVYADIAAESDCAALQATFDRAAENNDREEPGTDAFRWTTGYMTAANDRMGALGCFE